MVGFLLTFIFPLVNSGLIYPTQVRLSWTEKEHQIRVSYRQVTSTESYIAYRPILCQDNPEWTYLLTDKTRIDVGCYGSRMQFLHSGVISNLTEECLYQYTVGQGLFWSDTYVFSGRTPEYTSLNDQKPAKFIIFGDWGAKVGHYTKYLLKQQARFRDFEGILHMGDIAYNLHTDEGLVGDLFLDMIQEFSAEFPYMTLPGNHEYHFNNASQYMDRFKMPWNEYNQGTSLYYSFDFGLTHFIMFNTEFYLRKHSGSEGQLQLEWLKKDLEKAKLRRKHKPWVVLLTHHPFYCNVDWTRSLHDRNTECGIDAPKLRGILEDLLNNYSVDLVFHGHLHNYERDAPVYKNTTVLSELDTPNLHLNPKAPIYITSGNAGNKLKRNDPVSTTLQDWCRAVSQDYGYGKLHIYNRTHVLWEQYSSEKLKRIDHLWIIKNI